MGRHAGVLCSRGHVVADVGRTPAGHCRACKRVSDLGYLNTGGRRRQLDREARQSVLWGTSYAPVPLDSPRVRNLSTGETPLDWVLAWEQVERRERANSTLS